MDRDLFQALNAMEIMRLARENHDLDRQIEIQDMMQQEINADIRQLQEEIVVLEARNRGQQVVGRCPQCGEYWFTYDPYCGGCGFKRIDF